MGQAFVIKDGLFIVVYLGTFKKAVTTLEKILYEAFVLETHNISATETGVYRHPH